MNVRKKLTLFLVVFPLMFLHAQLAQVGMTGSGDILVTVNSQMLGKMTMNVPLDEIEFIGSPFINEEFENATIVYKDEEVGNMLFRYNAYNEEIELKESKYHEAKALRWHPDLHIVKNNVPLRLMEFSNKDKQKLKGYLFELIEGKFSLYKRMNVKFSEPKKATTSLDKDVPARFTQFEAFYSRIDQNEVIEISGSKKQFLIELPPQLRKKTAEFIKARKLKLKREEDLVLIFNFLNAE